MAVEGVGWIGTAMKSWREVGGPMSLFTDFEQIKVRTIHSEVLPWAGSCSQLTCTTCHLSWELLSFCLGLDLEADPDFKSWGSSSCGNQSPKTWCRTGNRPETERKLTLEGQLLSENHLQPSSKFSVPPGFGGRETVAGKCLGPPCPLGEGPGVCPSLLITTLLLGLLASCFFQLSLFFFSFVTSFWFLFFSLSWFSMLLFVSREFVISYENIVMMVAWKSSSDDFNILIILILASVECTFSLKLWLSWFSLWQIILYYILDIWAFMSGSFKSYYIFAFYVFVYLFVCSYVLGIKTRTLGHTG